MFSLNNKQIACALFAVASAAPQFYGGPIAAPLAYGGAYGPAYAPAVSDILLENGLVP